MARRTKGPVFGRDAPSERLAIPENFPILATEIFAYTPNSIRNPDVLNRFVQNGLRTHVAESSSTVIAICPNLRSTTR
jgi:hypothetical protein